MPRTILERLLNAIKIDPFPQNITSIHVANIFVGENGMYQHMQWDLIEHYPLSLTTRDVIWCDEEALLKDSVPAFVFCGYIITDISLIVGNHKS